MANYGKTTQTQSHLREFKTAHWTSRIQSRNHNHDIRQYIGLNVDCCVVECHAVKRSEDGGDTFL
jgi:hypothetical protein